MVCPGIKWLGREADHSPPFNAVCKKQWSYTSASSVPSWLTLGQIYFVFTSCYLLSNDYLGKRLSGSKSVVSIDQAQRAEGRLLQKHLTAFRSVLAVENRIIPCALLIRPQSVYLRSAVPEQSDFKTVGQCTVCATETCIIKCVRLYERGSLVQKLVVNYPSCTL